MDAKCPKCKIIHPFSREDLLGIAEEDEGLQILLCLVCSAKALMEAVRLERIEIGKEEVQICPEPRRRLKRPQ